MSFLVRARRKVTEMTVCNNITILLELTELVPGILPQLGPESLASLVRIAEAYKAHVAAGKNPEDIPELVESLQAAQLKQETA